jgi:hypothetical protein
MCRIRWHPQCPALPSRPGVRLHYRAKNKDHQKIHDSITIARNEAVGGTPANAYVSGRAGRWQICIGNLPFFINILFSYSVGFVREG